MPLSIAMAAPDTPGSRLRATNSRLNSALWSRRRRGALTTCLSMICTTGLMHTITGALDHAIVLIRPPTGKRAFRPRLRGTRQHEVMSLMAKPLSDATSTISRAGTRR